MAKERGHSSGGLVYVKGTGFTENMKVQVTGDPAKPPRQDFGFVSENLLLIDWPSGKQGADTKIEIERDASNKKEWAGTYS